MLKLFTNSLDQKRLGTWEKLADFKKVGILAGGTALAFQLNHRKSFDFDIFSRKHIGQNLLLKINEVFGKNNLEVVIDSPDELSVIFDKDIKISFVYFPFEPLHETILTKSLNLFDIRDLLSNKAYSIGRRGAWRDYADVYWALSRNFTTLPKLVAETQKRFAGAFSEKLFLEQLTYFGDINDWSIEWIKEKVDNEKIKEFLQKTTKEYLAKEKLLG